MEISRTFLASPWKGSDVINDGDADRTLSISELRELEVGSLITPVTHPSVKYNAVALKIGADVWALTAYADSVRTTRLISDFAPAWKTVNHGMIEFRTAELKA